LPAGVTSISTPPSSSGGSSSSSGSEGAPSSLSGSCPAKGRGLLEGRRDLPVSSPDQGTELADGLVEVLALLRQVGDVLARFGVFALGERVDRADLLAVAIQPGELGLDRLALLAAQGLGSGGELFAQRGRKPLQLDVALIPLAAQLSCLDLCHRHRLAGAAQLSLEAELLL
jgi:hypothetical protein